MDIVRKPERSNVRRGVIYAAVAIVAIVLTTVAFARLERAAPPVERQTLVIDAVQRGPLTRAVRGSGVLTPENIRWIAAATEGRVERVIVQPGTTVTADSVILELSDPQQQQSARDAEWQLRAAEAAYEAARAELESERLDREASTARLRAEAEQARLRAKADEELANAGLAAPITRQLSASNAASLEQSLKLEEQRLGTLFNSQRARLAVLRAEVEQRRAMVDLQRQRIESLQVRAGIDGVLQQVNVQAGQRITTGTNLARVAEPNRLKAEVRVAEGQAKDVVVGQQATIDTRNGIVRARVARVDPAVSNGTVVVDLTILEPLPQGARPDLTIDATIELDRIPQTLFVARPVGVQEMSSGTLFLVKGDRAERVNVAFGRASAEAIEIRSGLREGDQVIVSDTSNYERFDRLEIR